LSRIGLNTYEVELARATSRTKLAWIKGKVESTHVKIQVKSDPNRVYLSRTLQVKLSWSESMLR